MLCPPRKTGNPWTLSLSLSPTFQKRRKTSQESRMLSSFTLNCQVTKIVMNSGSQLSEMQSCLKWQKSLGSLFEGALNVFVFVIVFVFVFVIVIVMSPHLFNQMSQRSQVSRIALWRCSLNVFVFVIVFVFVFVIVVFWSGHVASSLWSNVSKVTSL